MALLRLNNVRNYFIGVIIRASLIPGEDKLKVKMEFYFEDRLLLSHSPGHCGESAIVKCNFPHVAGSFYPKCVFQMLTYFSLLTRKLIMHYIYQAASSGSSDSMELDIIF